MIAENEYVELPDNQKIIADQLLRNFLIVFVLAFMGELLLRFSPSFLNDFPERVWFEWLLVSLMGVSAYLLWNIAIWNLRPHADFVAYRSWYRAAAARGPVIAFVVLIALTNIDFRLSLPASQVSETEEARATVETADQPTEEASTFDLGINFGEASENVLLVSAFILGFYSRLANDVLGRIARFIFKEIYDETYKQEMKKDHKKEDGDRERDESD